MSICVLFTFVLLYSCERCRNTAYCELALVGRNYFDMYKEGAYWIYYNQDSSKVDSVYIINFENRYHKNTKEPCIEWNDITFNLENEYLNHGNVKVSIGNLGNCEIGSAHFLFSEGGGIVYKFRKGDTALTCPNVECNVMQPFQLRGDPKYTFYEVTVYDSMYWFAPEFGLIQYVSYNKLDTFYLNKFVSK